MLTRSDPPLPLARLRARGQMVEIRAEHLRFSIDETARFLNQVLGFELTREQVEALDARAEGWIVGLHLAALSMQGRTKDTLADFVVDFTGSHRYIVDYLVSEVLDGLPEAQREFLLKTAVLERLNADLCIALSGREDCREILQSLEQSNLFLIPMDDERGWYRYHHLFADMLRNHLRIEMADLLPSLHRRAAGWLAQNGLYVEAIEHAFAIPDYDFVRDLFRGSYPFMLRTENRAAVTRLYERLPQAYLLHNHETYSGIDK